MQAGSALQAAPTKIYHKISRQALENHVPQALLDPENTSVLSSSLDTI